MVALDDDAVIHGMSAFTKFTAGCIVYSNACGYPSCLLSLYVNTFRGMFVVC